MPWYVPVAMPVIFIALWLAVTLVIPKLSGWARLEELLPDIAEPAMESFGFQAFYLGKGKLGASYRGCVTFEVCESGLRVSIWKVFAPFSKPIFIPWDAVEVEPATIMAITVARLKIGPGGEYWMTIPVRYARNIARASGGRFILPGDN